MNTAILLISTTYVVGTATLLFASGCGSSPAVVHEAAKPQTAPSASVKIDKPKLALLVGVNKYASDKISPLRGCVNDVKSVEKLLTTKFEFPQENIVTLTDERATHATIVEAFQKHLIDKADAGTIVVFYFSGHGSQAKDDPAPKGDEPDGFDETIVCHDARMPDIYDITDDEINGLFSKLKQKTKNVTFVLDCCHSGTGTKDVAALARSAPQDERLPPALPAYAIAAPRGTETEESRFEGREYALISGCRANEVSFEYYDAATKQHCGALSHFLIRAIESAPGSATYRDIMDQVKSDVNKEYPSQHPQLEGAGMDNFLFDDSQSLAEPYVTVVPDGDVFRLDAGVVHGMSVGSVIAVYPARTKEFTGEPIGEIEVTKIEPFASQGKLIHGTASGPVLRGVVRQHAITLGRLRVFIDNPTQSETLAQIKTAIEDTSKKIDPLNPQSPSYADSFSVVSDSTEAQLVLKELKAGSRKEIAASGPNGIAVCSKDDEVLSPPVLIGADDAVARSLKQLVDWGKWFNLLDITNTDSAAARIDFEVTLPSGGKSVSITNEVDMTLIDGTEIQLTLKNNSSKKLYFTVLDFATDGSIGLVYPPPGENQAVTPMEPWTEKTNVAVPEGREKIRDFLKVIATQTPVDFSFVTQTGIRGLPKDTEAKNDPLVQLIGDRAMISRTVLPPKSRLDNWATKTVTLEVVKQP
jgi:hypothetical protein